MPLRSLAVGLAAAGLAGTAGSATLSFSDIWSAHSLPGTNGGHGAMFADMNDDGSADLYMPLNYGVQMRPDFFIRNDGGSLTEAGAAAGIRDYDEGSHGATWADLDQDGDYDLVNATTYGASNWNNVFRNDGDGTCSEIAPPPLQGRADVTRGLLAFDYDGDGDLDLFGVTNSKGTNDPVDERNELWRNDGGFRFTEIAAGELWDARIGQGATDTDWDGDGDVDVIAANRTGPAAFLRNDGGGAFFQVHPSALGITHDADDGITTADIDNDDDLDLLLAGDDVAELYRNDGAAFSHRASFTGTDGYMGGFADLDLDGDLDLVFAGADSVLLNDGSGTFTPGAPLPIANGLKDPRGIAFADVDGDGDPDFAVGWKNSRSNLYRNDLTGGGHWLRVRLVSPQGQAGAFGAKTRIYPAGQAGGTLLGLRESRSNHGYLAQDDPVLHFGLGGATAVDVVVTFADGSMEARTAVPADGEILIDGSGAPTGVPPVQSAAAWRLTAFPNPFTTAAELRWHAPAAAGYTVTVHDAAGRRVRTLWDGERAAGSQAVRWDGRDERGRRLPAGVYFYRVTDGATRAAARVTRIR